MQEEQTLAFQPIYEGYVPWLAKLFLVYLFAVLLMIAVRAVRFGWNLRRLRKLEQTESSDFSSLHLLWTKCYAKAHSLRDFAIITFLLSVLHFSWWAADIFAAVGTEKTTGLNYILRALADPLGSFLIGISFCIALYLCAVLGEYILSRKGTRFQIGAHDSNRA